MKKLLIIHFCFLLIITKLFAQTNYSNNTGQKTPLEREKILNQLKEKRDKVLNINNLFEIKIPKDIEIVSINQYLLLDRDNTQYGFSNTLFILYQNKFFFMDIDVYGNTNRSIFDGSEIYYLRKIINPHPYKSENQIKFLKENYINDPSTNRNKIKIGKYFSSWGTSWTSDYYGLYFKLPNNEFDECVISINNIWGTFAKSEIIDENYKTEIKKKGGNLEKIFNDLESMENSITFKLTNESIKIGNGSVGEQVIDSEYIYPTINNLRMRSQPSLDGEILGYMKKEMYCVVAIGEETEIEGIKGNWLLIIPWSGNSASWVFSGFTRKATDEEIYSRFEG